MPSLIRPQLRLLIFFSLRHLKPEIWGEKEVKRRDTEQETISPFLTVSSYKKEKSLGRIFRCVVLKEKKYRQTDEKDIEEEKTNGNLATFYLSFLYQNSINKRRKGKGKKKDELLENRPKLRSSSILLR